MNLIDTLLLDLFSEGKQVGSLYHFTLPYNLFDILETNMLKAQVDSLGNGVSLTRNKNLNWQPIRLELNGNLLSQHYRIYPTNWPWSNALEDKFYDKEENELKYNSSFRSESEERVLKDITNLSKYLISITFLAKFSYF